MSVPVSVILDRKGREVATVGPEATVTDVVRSLTDHGVGALVVVDADTVVGMISERDVVHVLAEEGVDALDRPVAAVMTQPVTTCAPDTTATELAATMTAGRVRHLPVVEEGGGLVGIVSIGDVVKSRLDELVTQTESLERYVTGTAY